MTLNYRTTESEGFEQSEHVLEMARRLALDDYAWISEAAMEAMEEEQKSMLLGEIKEAIAEAIAQEEAALAEAERYRSVCNIGPYSGGYCTICGGREP